MPTLSRKTPIWVPVITLLIAMISIQSGASLAKTLFPLVGAPGVTALRLALGTLILVIIFKPWRLRFSREQRIPLLMYGLALGGMNYLFYLSIRTVPLGIAVALEFTGPLALALFSSRRAVDFIWVILAVLGMWFLLPLGQDVTHVDPLGAACALGAGACWALYRYRPARRGRSRPGNGRAGFINRRDCVCAHWCLAGGRCTLALVAASIRDWGRYSVDRSSLLAGNGGANPSAHPYFWHLNEYGAGAGRVFRDDFPRRNPDRDTASGAVFDRDRLDWLHVDHQA